MRQFPRPVSQTKCSLSKCGNIPPRFLPWAVISPGHAVYYSLSITSRCAPSLQSVFCCFFSLPISVRVFIPRVSSHFSLYVPAPFILWVLHPAGTEGQIAPINLLQCACTVCIYSTLHLFSCVAPVCRYLNVVCITSVVFSFAGRVQGILCEVCWYLSDRFFSYLVWSGVHSHALFYESLLCRDCKLTLSPLPLVFLLFLFCPFITSLDHFSLKTLGFLPVVGFVLTILKYLLNQVSVFEMMIF